MLPIMKMSIVHAETLPAARKTKKKNCIYVTKIYFKRLSGPKSALERTPVTISEAVQTIDLV